MSDSFSFIKANRPKIGLVDFFDLGEIYTADQRDALGNIFLDPEALDQIYRLAFGGLTKEDVRTMGGLDKPVIHSFALASETLSGVGFDLSQQVRTDDNIGEPEKHSFSSDVYSDNVIVFHGGIAANNIEYNFLDENGEVRTTSVPTSRESLLNSIKNISGQITLASYPSLFRVRRRSHVNEIRLKSSVLIPRETVIESPTDILKVPVYMRTNATPAPTLKLLECYSTKNSPLILPVKISTNTTITIKRQSAIPSPFVFGWELRRTSDGLLVRSRLENSSNVSSVAITLDVIATPGQGAQCNLYIYLDPEQVTELDLSNLGMQEEAGKDIGLVGFNNLKVLNLSGNNLSTYPVWLKTLNSKLTYLNLSGNSFWNNGVVRTFDYQDLRGSGVSGRSDADPPSIAASQVLGYSGFGDGGAKFIDYKGTYDTMYSPSNGASYMSSRKNAIAGSGALVDPTEANGFRVFAQLKDLIVGPSVPFYNADFSYLFPNLSNFRASRSSDQPTVMYGLLPKFKNSLQPITLNYTNQNLLGGTINYMGDNLSWDSADSTDQKAQFVGQFKVKEFSAHNTRIGGGFLTGPSDPVSYVDLDANIATAWSEWLKEAGSITLSWYTKAYFRIASGSSMDWRSLTYLTLSYAWAGSPGLKIRYNSTVTTGQSSVDILTARALTQVRAWESGWGGKLFSISKAPALSIANFGKCNWEGYDSGDTLGGFKYILPDNFVDSSGDYALSELYLNSIINSQNQRFIFRKNDLENLNNLSIFYVSDSYVFGEFPTIYNTSKTAGKVISLVHAKRCNFRDLSALGAVTRIKEIYIDTQGAAVGGALMPQFVSTSNTTLTRLTCQSMLSSTYPSNWHEVGKRGKTIECLITGTTEENTAGGLTWSIDSYDNKRLIASSSGVSLSAYIMVGDSVISSGSEVGTVAQLDISNGYIYLSSGVDSLPSSSLVFRRKGQSISTFFRGHSSLDTLYVNNNKITGDIPEFTNCRSSKDFSLSDNLLQNYSKGTLSQLVGTSGTVKLKAFRLTRNPLTQASIRAIIQDCFDFVTSAGSRSYSIDVQINLTRYDSSTGSYRNWTKAEIFNGSTSETIPDPTEDDPDRVQTITIPDPLEASFNKMGTGGIYPRMRINLF